MRTCDRCGRIEPAKPENRWAIIEIRYVDAPPKKLVVCDWCAWSAEDISADDEAHLGPIADPA